MFHVFSCELFLLECKGSLHSHFLCACRFGETAIAVLWALT